MLKEFKKFIERGNVMDLAVGIIVGGAFNNIVSSLVNDVIMPLVGIIIGGVDFSNLSITLGEANIKYGMFIQNIVNFLIIAFCVFMLVRFLNNLTTLREKHNKKNEKEEKPAEAPVPVESELDILKDIRKELIKQNKKN